MTTSQQKHFSFTYAKQPVLSKRAGETRLGEKINFGQITAKSTFIILGISEDIGPQMNDGFSGSDKGFDVVINKLCGVQSNQFIDGSEICLLGEITQNQAFINKEECSGWIEELDQFVLDILSEHLNADHKLIVIGGGHNNAYPIIKHFSNSFDSRVNVINIDPHADCRTTEFRHSGNPFSFASNEELIHHYHILGLHEGYNNTFILDFLSAKGYTFQSFEDFLDNEVQFSKDLNTYIAQISDSPLLLDIDLDAIAFMPSSAFTPSGFSIENIRKTIRQIGKVKQLKSLHFPEGAPKTIEESSWYGKCLAYFICDFIKSTKD